MPAPELQLLISAVKDVVTVTLVGEAHFDLHVADHYLDEILSHKPKTVIVDAAKLSFISSVGMCLLVNLKRAVQSGGGALKLVALQPLVRDALHHAMLLPMFETHPDFASAMAAKD